MCNLFVPVACLVARLTLRKGGRVPHGAAAALNGVIAHFAWPAWPPGFTAQLVPMLMPWLTLVLVALALWLTSRLLHRASRAGIARPMSVLRGHPLLLG